MSIRAWHNGHNENVVKPDLSRFDAGHKALRRACEAAVARHMHELWSDAAQLSLLNREPVVDFDPIAGGLLAVAGYLEPAKGERGGSWWRVLRLEESEPYAALEKEPDFRRSTAQALRRWWHGSLADIGYEQIEASGTSDWRLLAYWHKGDYDAVPQKGMDHIRCYPKKLLPIRDARIILEIADKRAKGDLDAAMGRAPAWMTSPLDHLKHEGMFLLEHDAAMPLAKEMQAARKPATRRASKWDPSEVRCHTYPEEWSFMDMEASL